MLQVWSRPVREEIFKYQTLLPIGLVGKVENVVIPKNSPYILLTTQSGEIAIIQTEAVLGQTINERDVQGQLPLVFIQPKKNEAPLDIYWMEGEAYFSVVYSDMFFIVDIDSGNILESEPTKVQSWIWRSFDNFFVLDGNDRIQQYRIEENHMKIVSTHGNNESQMRMNDNLSLFTSICTSENLLKVWVSTSSDFIISFTLNESFLGYSWSSCFSGKI
eukprot:TRINITY_DN3567_c0_g2_i3.p1 TRINITY_DN3567_c0_g2~~TRINITY_DN3567_c0_g2_i3.p1  ORF type:complete len:218 (-),score=39.87 TRINITY_DN3567_c0_g2_i3:532-1185(-)